ncbi:Hemolymph lipopolysaccharide-binding protein [Gryllus bimaculatus]|nr:Hemolymph lipopolysaccharide-binding protein [Gryllus bimaculatus]
MARRGTDTVPLLKRYVIYGRPHWPPDSSTIHPKNGHISGISIIINGDRVLSLGALCAVLLSLAAAVSEERLQNNDSSEDGVGCLEDAAGAAELSVLSEQNSSGHWLAKVYFWQLLSNSGFTEWHPAEPNSAGGEEDCGSLYWTAQLNDVSCFCNGTFVCELPSFQLL